MTNAPHSIVGQPDERGSALVGVLLLLMMMSALAAALGVSGQTETLISRNQRSGAQAQAAAEAGLNHAAELATTYIFEWNANGFPSVEAAIDALLKGPDGLSGTAGTDADNLSLGTRPGITAAEDIPLATRLTITGGIKAEYEAIVMDDAGTAVGEEAIDDPFNDANATVIIRATGYAQDNTRVELEALISPILLPALQVCGDLTIAGNVDISGAGGDVHANGDLTISGNAASVEGTATASGTYTGNPAGSGGEPLLPCPPVRASDYRHFADFILTSTGTMTNLGGTLLCTWSKKTPCNNWDFNNVTHAWSIGNAAPPNGTYYVEGAVRITGSPGSAKAPVLLTLVAEGSIDISGSPDIAPDIPELQFVTDGDLKISGGPTTGAGQILVHEQIRITGNPSLLGRIVVENAPSVDPLVEINALSGNVDIIYNGGLGGGVFSVTGWREIR